MNAIQPYEGKACALFNLGVSGIRRYLHLYTNNYTPVLSSVVANFTEATFNGYNPLPFALDNYPTVDGAGQATGVKAVCTFTNEGATATLVYGWWIDLFDQNNVPHVWFAKLFDSPQTLNGNGGALNFQITMNAGDITPA